MKIAQNIEVRQHNPDLVNSIRGYVERGKFNKDSAIWVVHLGRTPTMDTKKSYGFERKDRDNFFSHFMGLSLTHRVDEMTVDTVDWGGNVNFLNFYLVELEPGEDTNITGELLEMIARGWGLET